MPNPFQRRAGTIHVETVAAGTLMMPDGRPVYAVSNYTTAPSDGRPLRTGSSTAPTDGTPVIAVSLYAAGTLQTPDGRPVYAISGASPYADSSYALALDFDDGAYWAGGAQVASLSAMSGYTYARSGSQGATDAAGAVAFVAANTPAINNRGFHSFNAATNLLLNAGASGGLSTQNVTVAATAYALSFIGTGTVTLSGASTAGPLVGTGANNRVVLNFTPTAGTLTLTVSGSVTFAGLLAGVFAEGGPIITTAGATAAIGAGLLKVGDAVGADADQLFVVRGAVQEISSARLAMWSDNTDANVVQFYHNIGAGQIMGGAMVASVSQYLQGVAYTDGTEVTVVMRRLGGNWRFGIISGGIITWAASNAGTFPTTLSQVNPGGYRTAGSAPNDQVQFTGRRLGTFTTDAEVLAAVAGI